MTDPQQQALPELPTGIWSAIEDWALSPGGKPAFMASKIVDERIKVAIRAYAAEAVARALAASAPASEYQPASVDFLPHDDILRFACRVLAGESPTASDKEEARRGLMLLRQSIRPVASAPSREVPGWMPIETAPKDGTRIILGSAEGAWMAEYRPVYPSGYRPENPWFSVMLNRDHMGRFPSAKPTHWMPLPAAPSPSVAAEETKP